MLIQLYTNDYIRIAKLQQSLPLFPSWGCLGVRYTGILVPWGQSAFDWSLGLAVFNAISGYNKRQLLRKAGLNGGLD